MVVRDILARVKDTLSRISHHASSRTSMIQQRLAPRFLPFVLPLVLLAAVLPCRARAEEPLRVLWIGNSYTDYHNLPKMVADLAKAGRQRPVVHDRQL